jgi:hypothetical protein
MKAMILVVALMVTLQYQIATAASYPVLYVRSNGTATWPCGTSIATSCKSIATAVAHANDYATTTIKVAQGDYAERVSIVNVDLPVSKSGRLTIEGGWNPDFTAQSADPTKTRVTPSTSDVLINISLPGLWFRVGLRLVYLTLEGTSDLQRLGLQALSAAGSMIDLVVEHCRIVSFRGPGVSLTADNAAHMTVAVHDTTIQNNHQVGPSWPGTGISVSAWNGSDIGITLTKNKIIANQGGSSGGGIYFYSSGDNMGTPATLTATLVNNILAENQAEQFGGAIFASATDGVINLTLTNNTISGNLAAVATGGIAFDSHGSAQITAEITNTIIWGNTDPATNSDIFINQYDSSTTAVTSYYSMIGVVQGDGDTKNFYHGYHNTHLNPALDKSYHLSDGSPAEDKGLCGEIIPNSDDYERYAPYDDIDGDERPGWKEELGCDIGADEYQFPWILFNPAFMKKH